MPPGGVCRCVVHVVNEHPALSDVGDVPVPLVARRIAAFEQEIVVVGRRAHEVSFVVGDGPQLQIAPVGDLLRFGPSDHPALQDVECRGRASVVVVAAAAHERIRFERRGVAARARIVRVVEVGPAEHVAEFVAEGPDAGHHAVGVQFRRAGVACELHSVQQDIPVARVALHVPPVWPDRLRVGRLGLVVSRVEHEDVADHAVVGEQALIAVKGNILGPEPYLAAVDKIRVADRRDDDEPSDPA